MALTSPRVNIKFAVPNDFSTLTLIPVSLDTQTLSLIMRPQQRQSSLIMLNLMWPLHDELLRLCHENNLIKISRRDTFNFLCLRQSTPTVSTDNIKRRLENDERRAREINHATVDVSFGKFALNKLRFTRAAHGAALFGVEFISNFKLSNSDCKECKLPICFAFMNGEEFSFLNTHFLVFLKMIQLFLLFILKQVISLFLIAFVVGVQSGILAEPAAAIISANSELAEDAEFDSHPQYSFHYSVNDDSTGDHKSQTETRDGDVVSGQVSFLIFLHLLLDCICAACKVVIFQILALSFLRN